MGRRGLWAPLCLALALPEAGQGASVDVLRFADDLDRPLDRPVEVCFQLERATECTGVAPGGTVSPPAGFRRLRVEGPDHGPVSLRRSDLPPPGHPVKVARKAFLEVAAGFEAPLTLSLYDPRDETMRTPAFRAPVPATGAVKVPAGELIASLAAPSQAPDLHRLSAGPAARVRLRHHPRSGWSLVLRCQDAAGKPQARAAVRLQAAEGYGSPGSPPLETTTGDDGLALLSGVPAALASAAVRREGFLPEEVRGLSAAPGTFAFREVGLARGGSIRARVTLDGKPLAGARCQVVDPSTRRAVRPAVHLRELLQGEADRSGVCALGPLPAGSYALRVKPAESGARVDRPVSVLEGGESELDVALSPIRVTGTVRRGGRPAAGYVVRAQDVEALALSSPADDPTAQATSDEEGRYELTLWSPGEHGFTLRTPAGTPAAVPLRRRFLAEGDEESLDFDLAPAAVRGQVVDEGRQPIAGAQVILRWSERSLLLAETGESGEFEFPVEEGGRAELRAGKSGYRPGEPREVVLDADVAPPPVVLVLRRGDTVLGTLVAASGMPVAGAWVGVTPARHGDAAPAIVSTMTDERGRFELERPGPGPLRLYATGPGCPLASSEPSPEGETLLRCPAQPANLDLKIRDEEGRPVPRAAVLLRLGGVVVPGPVLAHHLALLGLAAESDGSGRLVLPALAAGPVDVFLAGSSSEGSIEAGSPSGYLTSLELAPLATAELEVVP